MGWIKLDRQIMNNFLYTSEPFDKCHAWIDLILLANHEDTQLLSNKCFKEIKRGQLLTSTQILAKRWQWSRNKVCRFLGVLNDAKMIEIVSGRGAGNGTIITLVNYDVFQNRQSFNGAIDEAIDGANGDTIDEAIDGALTRTKEYKEYKEHKNRPSAKEQFEQTFDDWMKQGGDDD